VYDTLENNTLQIVNGIKANLNELGLAYTINQIGSMFSLFFTDKKVIDMDTARNSDTALFGRYFRKMLEEGVYLAPSQFETLFVSTALSSDDIAQVITANKVALQHVLS